MFPVSFFLGMLSIIFPLNILLWPLASLYGSIWYIGLKSKIKKKSDIATEVAKATVVLEKGTYRCELSFIDKPSLYALFSLYTIKLKWVFLTEPAANYLFKETIEEVIKKNFQINFDELMPKEDIISLYSERYHKFEFWITIERIRNKYNIISDWSPSVMPVAELVCHYFILLKKALEYLNEEEKTKLLNLLKKIHEMNISDNSIFAPIRYTNMANKILKEIIEENSSSEKCVAVPAKDLNKKPLSFGIVLLAIFLFILGTLELFTFFKSPSINLHIVWGCLAIASGIGLLLQKFWAYRLTQVLVIINLVTVPFYFFLPEFKTQTFRIIAGTWIVINGVALWYLSRKNIKEQFLEPVLTEKIES
jgi:uncharacterized membrane protein HdeD (DUF308 family)